jgi:hypothetical protein
MATNYLRQDPGMRQLIDQLESKDTPLVVIYALADARGDFSTSNGDAIAWNPYLAGQGTENGYGPRKADGPPGSQSPAMLLGHEMAHAAGGPMTKQLHRFPAGDFGNMEEERVIKGPETDAARSLGEDTRDDHGGKYVPAQGPTDRGEANEPK